MPELPEVETIKRQLDRVLVGQKIKLVEKLHKKSFQGESLKVMGKKIVAVKRKAKMIWIDLEGDLNLLVHLKMTGQLIYQGEVGKHTRVVFELSRGRLIFNDLRKFGWIKVVTNQQLQEHFTIAIMQSLSTSQTWSVFLGIGTVGFVVMLGSNIVDITS